MSELDTTTGEELGSGAFLKLREAKRNERESSLKRKRRDEARAVETLDARFHSRINANGKVQFNTRLRPAIKNQVVELSRETGQTVEEVVDKILSAYFQAEAA